MNCYSIICSRADFSDIEQVISTSLSRLCTSDQRLFGLLAKVWVRHLSSGYSFIDLPELISRSRGDLNCAFPPAGSTVLFHALRGRLNHQCVELASWFQYSHQMGWKPGIYCLSEAAFGEHACFSSIYRALELLSDQSCGSNHIFIAPIGGEIATTALHPSLSTLDQCHHALNKLGRALSFLKEIYKCHSRSLISNELDEGKSIKASVHLSRGDLGVLRKSTYRNTALYELFENDLLCFIDGPGSSKLPPSMRGFCWLSDAQLVDLITSATSHVGQRYNRQLPFDKYSSFLQGLASKINGLHFSGIVFSDGFTRHANFLAKGATHLTMDNIENIINAEEFSQWQSSGFAIKAGEPSLGSKAGASLEEAIGWALDSDYVCSWESEFPGSFLRIINS